MKDGKTVWRNIVLGWGLIVAMSAIPLFAAEPGATSGDLSSMLVNLVKAKLEKSAPEKKDVSSTPPPVLIDQVVPSGPMFLLRTCDLSNFDQEGKLFLSKIGLGALSPLEWMKWSPYGRCLEWVDRRGQFGLAYYRVSDKIGRILIVPVTNYQKFAESLGVSSEKLTGTIPEKTPVEPNRLKGYRVWTDQQYALISEPALLEPLKSIISRESIFKTELEGPVSLKAPLLSIEVFSRGIAELTTLRQVIQEHSGRFLTNSFQTLGVDVSEQSVPENALTRVSELLRWLEEDLQYLRIDISMQEQVSIYAFTCIPKDKTLMMAQIQDTYQSEVSVEIGAGHFLKVVPEYLAPISGQIDISPTAAAVLEPPFDRLRHVEYSLTLPRSNELLAESWCFFLEVDDAESFLDELSVPKAQRIGAFEGSEKLGALGAELLGNMAARRQARQSGRRFPRATRDPAEAAAIGGDLGARLGDAIGRSLGEQEAKKTFDFDGYPLRINDLELYSRKMREIRAKEAGLVPPKPVILDGRRTLLQLVSNVVNGVESGSLEGMVQNAIQSMSQNTELTFASNAPLLARRNLNLILDPHHILIVPGDDGILREAKNNWEAVRDRYLPPPESESQPTPSSRVRTPSHLTEGPLPIEEVWNLLLAEIPEPEEQCLRSVTRWDPFGTRLMTELVRADYIPSLPPLLVEGLGKEIPRTLFVTSTTKSSALFYHTVPHQTSAALFTIWLNLKKAKELPKK